MLLHPDRYSDEDIVRTLREQQLDYPGPGYLPRLRATLRPPSPFYPMVETDFASYRFLQKHKVHRLFFRDEHVDAALSILQTPRAKEVVESMLLVGDGRPVICSRLRRFGFTATAKAVEYYEHFFMNTKLVDPLELRALMSIRVEDIQLQGNDPETVIRYKAMKQAMYNDPRFMAVNAPSPVVAAMRLQLRHGLMPNRVDYGRLAEGVRYAALLGAHDAVLRGGPKAAVEARDYAVVVGTMDSILREKGGADEDLQNDLRAIMLGTDDTAVQSIKQLTSGNFTDSIDMTLEEAEHAKR